MNIPPVPIAERTLVGPNELRLTLEFGYSYGVDRKTYGTIIDLRNFAGNENAAENVAKIVERTIRHHYGFDPIMEEA